MWHFSPRGSEVGVETIFFVVVDVRLVVSESEPTAAAVGT